MCSSARQLELAARLAHSVPIGGPDRPQPSTAALRLESRSTCSAPIGVGQQTAERYIMASSVAPLALSHAMRRWNRNSPNDKQTRAAAVDTLRAEDELELVGAIEVLAVALGDEASLRWVSGAGAPGAAPALGLTASWLHHAVVRWALRFVVLAAARHGRTDRIATPPLR